jgi:hypothetical protein
MVLRYPNYRQCGAGPRDRSLVGALLVRRRDVVSLHKTSTWVCSMSSSRTQARTRPGTVMFGPEQALPVCAQRAWRYCGDGLALQGDLREHPPGVHRRISLPRVGISERVCPLSDPTRVADHALVSGQIPYVTGFFDTALVTSLRVSATARAARIEVGARGSVCGDVSHFQPTLTESAQRDRLPVTSSRVKHLAQPG